jgi:hypothetical protein
VPGAAGRGRAGKEAAGFGDGERDHPELGGPGLVWARWGGCGGAGAAAEQGGGDGADGQGGHDQDGVPGDGGVEADLGLVEPETAFPEVEIFFNQPLLIPLKLRGSPARRPDLGQY